MSAKQATAVARDDRETADTRLSKKISYRKGGDLFDPIAAAEKSMDNLSNQFGPWLEAEIAKLTAAWTAYTEAGRTDEHLKPLVNSAHEVKSLGGTLGFTRTGEAAASLVRLFEYIPDSARLPGRLVDQHVHAVRAIFHEIGRAGKREAEKMAEATNLVHELVDATNALILARTGGKPPETAEK